MSMSVPNKRPNERFVYITDTIREPKALIVYLQVLRDLGYFSVIIRISHRPIIGSISSYTPIVLSFSVNPIWK